jgi:hypothetical protein
MSRVVFAFATLLAFGAMKLPAEHSLSLQHRQLQFADVADLDLREKIGQLGFIAALSGFRAMLADFLFIQAHVALERTEWGRVLFLFQQVTTLQPHVPLFWDMAAWHMAWNASAAAMNDQSQPRLALRVKAQREYFALGKDFLERGIKNNPDKPQLYEAMARRNVTPKRPRYPARRVTTNVSPPTSFRIAKAGNAKLMNVCARFTTKAKRSDSRL